MTLCLEDLGPQALNPKPKSLNPKPEATRCVLEDPAVILQRQLAELDCPAQRGWYVNSREPRHQKGWGLAF